MLRYTGLLVTVQDKNSTCFVSNPSLFESVQTGFAQYSASYEMGTAVSDRSVKLTTHYHLVPTIKMSDTIHHHFVYTFTAYRATGFSLKVLPF
jgi:hypothetical protein